MMLTGIRRLLAGVVLLGVPALAHAAPPTVAVSVLPVHSLVAAVMDGVGAPGLLLPAGHSPHGGQLKPSQARLLESAELIFWVGPALEQSLRDAINARAGVKIITLTEQDAITVLADHGHADPHLWLSVANARAIAAIAARELSRMDPVNRAHYQANAQRLFARLEKLRHAIRARLVDVTGARYVVFHDAYRYFEREFGLRPQGVVAVNPHRRPGAKRIRDLRRMIASRNIRCVFTEPQFPPKLARTLVADTGAKLAVLDPLGAGLQPGPAAWFKLMEGLAESLLDCLTDP